MRSAMAGRLSSTVSFFGALARDLAGTLRRRWRRFLRRLRDDRDVVSVGVDVYPFTEVKTGVGWYEWYLLQALDRRDDGIEYNLYGHTFLAPDETAPPEMPGHVRMRLRTHHLPTGFLLPVGPTLWLLRRTVEPLLRVLDDNDVVFAPNFFPHADQLPFGRSLVATVHDLAFAVMPETVAPETLSDLRDRLPATLFRADRLIAVSDATAGDLEAHLGTSRRRVHTIHEGLDPDLADEERLVAAQRPEVPTPYVLFVSTFEPRKNLVGVLRAFRLVVEWGYPGSLVLVGRWGWRTNAIRRELDGSPARARIVHLDYLPRESLLALYRDADCLLFPSWLEGFGLPLLEAMACRTPVVTSGRSAMPEVAGPAAVYVDPGSVHGIASAVASLLADRDHRARLADGGRRRALRFQWDRAAAATAATLRLAAGRPLDEADEYRV